jgi:hypothetical protein
MSRCFLKSHRIDAERAKKAPEKAGGRISGATEGSYYGGANQRPNNKKVTLSFINSVA